MQPASFKLLQAFVFVVLGLVIGVTATWTMLIADLDAAAPIVDAIIRVVLPAIGLFVLLLAVLVPLSIWALQRFFKNVHGTLTQLSTEAFAAARAAAERDAVRAIDHAERAVQEAVAWYTPAAARRWIVSTCLALLVALGGLLTAALLFRQTVLLGEQNKKLQEQTVLLRDQNEKIDLQTVTAEAQRRSGLSTELFSILADVAKVKPGEPLPGHLRTRIIALSRAAIPYWTVEIPDPAVGSQRVPGYANRPRSPERGQLLIGLVAFGVPVSSLDGAVFDHADLRRAPLDGADLSGVSLNQADLSFAELRKANLSGAKLGLADMSYAAVVGSSLEGAVLDGVILGRAVPGLDMKWILNAWPDPLPAQYEPIVRGADVIFLRKGGPPPVLPFIVPAR